MKLTIDPDWLLLMAEREGNGIVSVVGLATRLSADQHERCELGENMKLEDMTDDQIVDNALEWAMRAGRSNSGLVISASAGTDWAQLQAYREGLKKRLKDLRSLRQPE